MIKEKTPGMTGVQMLIHDLETKKISLEDLMIVKDMYLHTDKDIIEQAYRIGSVSVLDEDLYIQAERYYENNYGIKK